MLTPAVDGPTVALSFANNFWGKDDAGVGPLLERMQGAKQTCDELRAFYNARASIEDEYARKLLSLCRKPLGSHETGGLKTSLDTMRGEVESMAKQHQSIAAQMKTELEEPLAAFAGAMKERRKIVQNSIEKLHKAKTQQTQMVNKTRDRYEQECLKIKGYLAQGHMVMGQEERKNKAKLEKTQISVATSNTEYENAVKILEETTARWNREWKAAADKFQDLEEERLDFTKSSLWSFANIASTVCVSDDASCEKIRLSLEKLEVEKDIVNFIRERGTGQEIPDPPKYINFCRGDLDSQSEASEDENYSVAQFPRSINPAYRTSSPQPSTYESHHDPNNTALARDLGHDAGHDLVEPLSSLSIREQQQQQQQEVAPHKSAAGAGVAHRPVPAIQNGGAGGAGMPPYDANDFAPVPHDPYPMDGMTMLCRTGHGGPPSQLQQPSDLGSQVSSNSAATSARPSSRDSHSDFSNLTPYSSQELPGPSGLGGMSPVKQEQPRAVVPAAAADDKKVMKKKSGFFQNHSPFRRKSTKDISASAAAANRNTWHVSAAAAATSPSQGRGSAYGGGGQQQQQQQQQQHLLQQGRSVSPDPIDANASLALNVGQNVFPVSTPDRRAGGAGGGPGRGGAGNEVEAPEDDPIALALAELKGVTVGKQSSGRMSADHYHGIATPAPGARGNLPSGGLGGAGLAGNSAVAAGMRGTPPPSYDQQVQRLGVPSPAVTSKAMKQTSQKFVEQTRSMFSPPGGSGGSGGMGSPARSGGMGGGGGGGGRSSYDMPRAASPAPRRSASPRPGAAAATHQQQYQQQKQQQQQPQYDPRASHRSVSPNPYASRPPSRQQQQPYQQPPQQHANTTPNRGSDQYYRNQSPNDMSRAASPSPYRAAEAAGRPRSSMASHNSHNSHHSHNNGDMAVQLSPYGGDDGYGSQRSRGGSMSRPGTSNSNSRAMGLYEGAGPVRQHSKGTDGRAYTRDGRPILHFARALYVYQAAIPEELGFAKGEMLAVLRHQDDGWWEATVHGGNGQVGLVPSNYLQPC